MIGMEKTEQKLIIYHNENCSKSTCALDIVKNKGIEFELVPYLKETPSIEELKIIIQKLQYSPHDLIRTNEPVYKEKFAGLKLTDDEWIEAMEQYPILIQRPILVRGDKAIIGRSIAAIQEIF